MPSQLVCRPAQDLPVGVLSVSGVLDRVTGDALGAAVRRNLSMLPVKLLLDVAGLRIAGPHALDALGSAVCQTADFPGVPIVVCGADPQTRATLAEARGCAGLELVDDCARALTEAHQQPLSPRIRVRLRPVPDACRQVRQLVTQACTGWHRPEIVSTATLVATELVANVVRHAHTTMEFSLGLRGDRLTVAVRDGSLRMPKRRDPTVAEAGGRGLRLVSDLTDGWGVLPLAGGKVVWTRFSATPA